MQLFGNKAQGAIEYLLIIGAAILVVAIVVIAITSVLSQGQSQVIIGNTSYASSVDTLKEGSGNYTRVGGGYYLNSSPILSNAVGVWRLDTVSIISSDKNSSPNSLPKENIDLSCTGASCPTIVPGLFGANAYSFDGVDDYMEFDSLNIDNTSFTFSAWVKIKDYASNSQAWGYELFGYDEYPNCGFDFGTRGHALAVASDLGKIGYWSDNKPSPDGYGFGSSAVGTKLPLDTWMMLTFVFDKSQNKATSYINGVPDIGPSVNQLMYPVKQCANKKLWLGQSAVNTGTFNGLVQSVSIWTRALTPDEVKELYSNSVAK